MEPEKVVKSAIGGWLFKLSETSRDLNNKCSPAAIGEDPAIANLHERSERPFSEDREEIL
jgi:hypothetical protein